MRDGKGAYRVVEAAPLGVDGHVAALGERGVVHAKFLDVLDLFEVRAVGARAKDGTTDAPTSGVRAREHRTDGLYQTDIDISATHPTGQKSGEVRH